MLLRLGEAVTILNGGAVLTRLLLFKLASRLISSLGICLFGQSIGLVNLDLRVRLFEADENVCGRPTDQRQSERRVQQCPKCGFTFAALGIRAGFIERRSASAANVV